VNYGLLFLTGIPVLAAFWPKRYLAQLRLVAIMTQLSALLLLLIHRVFPGDVPAFSPLSLTFLLLTIVGTLAVLSQEPTREQMVAFALVQLALETVYLTSHLLVFYGLWLGASLPLIWLLVSQGRSQGLSWAFATLLSMVPLFWLMTRIYGLTGSFDLSAWVDCDPQVAWPLFIALLLACGIRLGLFPFHGWLVSATQQEELIAAVTLGIFAPSGFYALLRLGQPIFASFQLSLLFTLGLLGIVNFLFSALVALAPRSPREPAAWVTLAYAGLAFLSLSFPELDWLPAVRIVISCGLGVILYLLTPNAPLGRNISLLALMGLPGLGSFVPFSQLFQTLATDYGHLFWPVLVGFLLLLLSLVQHFRTPQGFCKEQSLFGPVLLVLSLGVWNLFLVF